MPIPLSCFRRLAVFCALAFATSTFAQTLYWNPTGSTTGQGGSGIWSSDTAAWNESDTASDTLVNWTNGHSAVFAGTGGMITNNSALSADTVEFAGDFTLAGAGSLAASGGVTITDGTLTLGHSLALQSSTLDTSGAGTLSFGNLTMATLGGITGSHPITLANSDPVPAPVTLSVGGDNMSTTFDGNIQGNGTLVKTGTGRLTLTGEFGNQPFVVEAGTLRLNPLPGWQQNIGGDLAVAAGATVEIGGYASSLGLSGAGEVVFDPSYAHGHSRLTVIPYGSDALFSGNVSTIKGTSLLQIYSESNAMTLTGQIAVVNLTSQARLALVGGTFAMANFETDGPMTISDGAVVTISQGAIRGFEDSWETFIYDWEKSEWKISGADTALTVTDTLRVGSGQTTNRYATPTATAGTQLTIEDGAFVSSPHIEVGHFYESNDINGVGVATITLGGTADSRGVLATGSITTSEYAARRTIVFDGGILRLTADNPNLIVDPTSSSSVVGGTFTGITTLASGGGFIDTDGYAVGITQVIDGIGGLTKLGASTLTLSGANTYEGATTVSAGTLLITGSLGDSAVTVESGATFGGTGTIGGLTTVANGGHLAPGTSAGTLTFLAGLTLVSGAILDFELGTTSDRIDIAGGLLTGPGGTRGITLNLSDAGGFEAGTYILFNFVTGALSDFSVSDFALGTLIDGTSVSNYVFAFTSNSLTLTYGATAIPEPSTYATMFGAAALGLAAWRRLGLRRTRVTS